MIKSFSLAAMTALMMVGCNSGSTSEGATAATLADAEVIANKIGSSVSIGNDLGKQGTNGLGSLSTKSRSLFNQSCLNGGNMIMNFDENQFITGQQPTSVNMRMEAVNCVEDGETINGKMVFDIAMGSDDFTAMDMSFPTDFTVTAQGQTMKIFAGGSMKIEEQAPYEVMTINMRMTDGTETYGGKNLVYKMQERDNGEMLIFPVSGEENFGTGAYFKVNPNYDASLTPMVTDYEGNLQAGGLFKYLDAANHKVEVETTAENEVTVRIDENDNGSFEENEIKIVPVG